MSIKTVSLSIIAFFILTLCILLISENYTMQGQNSKNEVGNIIETPSKEYIQNIEESNNIQIPSFTESDSNPDSKAIGQKTTSNELKSNTASSTKDSQTEEATFSTELIEELKYNDLNNESIQKKLEKADLIEIIFASELSSEQAEELRVNADILEKNIIQEGTTEFYEVKDSQNLKEKADVIEKDLILE